MLSITSFIIAIIALLKVVYSGVSSYETTRGYNVLSISKAYIYFVLLELAACCSMFGSNPINTGKWSDDGYIGPVSGI